MSATETEKKPIVHAPSPNPPPSFTKPLTGSHYEKFSNILMGQIGNALFAAHTEEDRQSQIDGCAEELVGIAPQDEVEGLLAAQMVACHSATVADAAQAAADTAAQAAADAQTAVADAQKDLDDANLALQGQLDA